MHVRAARGLPHTGTGAIDNTQQRCGRMATNSFSDILDGLRDARQDSEEKTTLDDIVKAFQQRGFGPLLVAPALVMVLPTGAIPTIPSLCALLVLLISVQTVFGKQYPWLPNRLREISFDGDKLEKGLDKLDPYAQKVDRYTSKRLRFLTRDIARRLAALLCCALAVVIVPLELVPFAVFAPGLAILIIGLGLALHDGILMLVGFIGSTAALIASIWWLTDKL